MKKAAIALMTLCILFGVALVATPLIAHWWLPSVPVKSLHAAEQYYLAWLDQSRQSIRHYQTQEATLESRPKLRWHQIHIDSNPVIRLVTQWPMAQKDIDAEFQSSYFLRSGIGAPDWWKPLTLERQSYFVHHASSFTLYLMYNDHMRIAYVLQVIHE